MRAVGLITEYNPFHNGHLYHLKESLKLAGADVSVAVMSGHFLQRGEAALVDKWARAKMALAGGVDLVVELPLPWACASAPDFARGAVQALDLVGGVDTLCFGSESGCLADLQQWGRVELEQDDEIATRTAVLLRRGKAYPLAKAEVLKEFLAVDQTLLAQPNNILGLEYLKALAREQLSIAPLTVRRIGAGFHDSTIVDGISSATGIRQRLDTGGNVEQLLPEAVFTLLHSQLISGHCYCPEQHFRLLLGQIFSAGDLLEDLWLVDEGMGQRILQVAENAATMEELIAGIKSRHLTRTRIQRLLLCVLLCLERATADQLLIRSPAYLHLLAASEQGMRFLAATRKQRKVPLVQNFSRVYSLLKRHYGMDTDEYQRALLQLQLELKATRLYGLLMEKLPCRQRSQDFYQPLITCG